MSTAYVNRILPKDAARVAIPGHVIQVVQSMLTTTVTGTASSFSDIPSLSVSITPSNMSSKILVCYNVITGEGAGQFPMIRINRNGTPVGVGTSMSNRTAASSSAWSGGAENMHTVQSMSFLDSPLTISTLIYKLQISAGNSGDGAFYINRCRRNNDALYEPSTISTITLMEIAQ